MITYNALPLPPSSGCVCCGGLEPQPTRASCSPPPCRRGRNLVSVNSGASFPLGRAFYVEQDLVSGAGTGRTQVQKAAIGPQVHRKPAPLSTRRFPVLGSQTGEGQGVFLLRPGPHRAMEVSAVCAEATGQPLEVGGRVPLPPIITYPLSLLLSYPQGKPRLDLGVMMGAGTQAPLLTFLAKGVVL